MAASLLAGIDWNNLSSAEMTNAVRILCIAMQERFNIAAMRMDGTYSTSGSVANPSDDILKNMFPYGGNNPRWPLNDGDPLVNYTGSFAAQDDLNHLILNTAQNYADIERWNDDATNKASGGNVWTLSYPADDPGTYANRLLEVTGYTTYPDLSVMAPEEVKKLYDMVVIMRYARRDPQSQLRANVHRIFEGEFDISQAATYVVEDPEGDGANYYNAGSSAGVIPTNTAPYTAFNTGNGNLFGTPGASFDESVDSGTFEPPFYHGVRRPYFVWLRRFNAGGDKYTNFIKAYQTQHVIDWSVPRALVGFIGLPLAYLAQNNMSSLVNAFPAGHDTLFDYPAATTTTDQRYWETVTDSEALDVVTMKRDNLLVGVTLPATPSSIASGESIEVEPFFGTNLISFHLEDWDGEGGFVYYS